MDYQVKLEVFEGPVEQLLYLVKKNSINIWDVSITRITEQYLDYLGMINVFDLERSGEFLLIIASLLYLKSEMLLPAEEKNYAELIEEEEVRQELANQILEYQQFKKLASWLGDLEETQKNLFSREEEVPGDLYEEVNLYQLLSSLEKVLSKAAPVSLYEVRGEEVNISQKMEEILGLLNLQEVINFNELFRQNQSKLEIIALFLALLELIRLRKVKTYQLGDYGEVCIRRR